MNQISDRYRRLAEAITSKIAAVPADRWESPSPCADWTARDVVRHLIEAQQQVIGHVGLVLESGPPVEEDPMAAWVAARDSVQKILDDPERARLPYDGFFGPTTLAATIDRFIGFDLVIHGWDLARATGQDERIDPVEVRRVFEDARALGDNLRLPGVCGPEVSAPPDADEQTRLLAYVGRRV